MRGRRNHFVSLKGKKKKRLEGWLVVMMCAFASCIEFGISFIVMLSWLWVNRICDV